MDKRICTPPFTLRQPWVSVSPFGAGSASKACGKKGWVIPTPHKKVITTEINSWSKGCPTQSQAFTCQLEACKYVGAPLLQWDNFCCNLGAPTFLKASNIQVPPSGATPISLQFNALDYSILYWVLLSASVDRFIVSRMRDFHQLGLWAEFHQLGPLGQVGLVVAMCVCLFVSLFLCFYVSLFDVPFSCNFFKVMNSKVFSCYL